MQPKLHTFRSSLQLLLTLEDALGFFLGDLFLLVL